MLGEKPRFGGTAASGFERRAAMPPAGSHARRKFFDLAKQSAAAKTAYVAVEKINAIFTIERESSEAMETPEQRHERRQRDAGPKLDELKLWLENELSEILPKNADFGYHS